MKTKSLITLALTAVCAVSGIQASAQMGGPAVVSTAQVSEVQESGTKKYVGQIRARGYVSVRARVSGKIEEMLCKEGDLVKKGDLLFTIEDETYIAAVKSAEAMQKQADAQKEAALAAVKQAEAQMETAKATLTYAKAEKQRQDELISVSSKKERDIAVRDLNLANAAMAAAEGQLATAKAQLSLAEAAKATADAALMTARINLDYTKIHADIDGRLGKATFSPGNYVTPSSEPLITIAQLTPVNVRFAISEPHYLSMFGSPKAMIEDAVIRIRLADRTLHEKTAKVRIVDNAVDTTTDTIMIWAGLDNTDEKLFHGAIVDVLISKKDKEKRLAVPAKAVLIGKDGHYVWVAVDGKAMPRPVVCGEAVGDMQVILSGLNPGDTVVTSGTHKIMMPGMPLQIVNTPAK